jgi:hypothetical protein
MVEMMNANQNIIRKIKNVKINSNNYEDFEKWNNNLKENNKLTCVHVNVRSLRKHWESLLYELKDAIEKIDVIVLTEVNVNDEEATVYQMKNFKQTTSCRKNRKGGGIIIYYRDNYVFQKIVYNFEQTESLNIKLTNAKEKIEYTILAIYRPPSSNIELFLTDLQWWLNNGTKKNDTILMVGDINICTLQKNTTSSTYLNMLYSNEFVPTIRSATREEILAGNVTSSCLDHINVKLKHKYDFASAVITTKISDHYFVAVQFYQKDPLVTRRELNQMRYVEVLNNKKINKEISDFNWEEFLKIQDPEELYQAIVRTFQEIYNKCSTVKPRTKKDDLFPWVTSEIKEHIKEKKKIICLKNGEIIRTTLFSTKNTK